MNMGNAFAQFGQRNLNNGDNIFFINGYMKESRNGTDNFEDLLIPSRYSLLNHDNNKFSSDHSIYLLSKACNFDIFKYIPQQFTITTINSSGKFNKDMLANTSSVISDFLKENPNQFQYHVDIKDDDNTISKFEQLYQGQKVTFDEYELIFTRKFTEKLNLINFPNFIKPKNMKSNFDQTLYANRYRSQAVDYSDLSVKIGLISFKSYLQNISTCTFKIKTKKAEYKCSIFGVISSTLIRDLISKDPMIDHYFYDYEDEEGEFQFICDLFNFKRINLTRDNAEIIKEIGEDLKIDFILSSTEKFIVDSEKVLKAIDDQQSIIDTIDDLFDLLYSIKDKSVNMVASIIMDSKWSSSEEKIIELSAFILQVISNSIQLHPYLVDLLLKLDENSGEKIELKKLIPFIIHQLFLYMTNSSIHIEKRNNKSFYPFIYQLYKRNIIKKEQLLLKLKNTGFSDSYLISWFIPEIIEANPDYSNYVYNENENSVVFKECNPRHRLIFPCNLNKLDEFIKMRDKGEYDDEIANALRIDDVDTFQSIVSRKGENFLNETIKINIFEPFLNEDTRFLNYAAAYGSIKCFKYLLLNDEKVDQSTFGMAVLGGNNELIRIVDNEKKNTNTNVSTNNKRGPFTFHFTKSIKRSIYNNNISPLALAIKNHRNDLLDWLLEQNIEKISKMNTDQLLNLIFCSIENGNAHSIVQLVDNGFKFQSYTKSYSKFLSLACENGFSLLANLLIRIISKDTNQEISINPRSSVIFGSLSIFQLFEKTMNQTKLHKALIEAIKLNSTNIINYFFESLIDHSYVLNEENSIQILQNTIANNTNEMLNYVFDKINSSCPLKLFKVSSLYDLLKTTIKNNEVVISKKIIDFIYDSNSNYNFTNVFYQAVLANMKEIIEYLIDKKCIIFYENIVDQLPNFGSIDVDIFSLIMSNVNSLLKQIMSNSIDDAIKNKNKPLIEYLLKQDALLPSSLIEAVCTNDLEIVEMILKKDSSPSFINKNLKNGNALLISVQNNNLPIFKRLISIPGINPSIYYKKMKTPLVLSALNSNEKMFDLLIEFYGEKNIKSQKWQLEKAIEIIEDQDKPAPSKPAFSKYKVEIEKNVDSMKPEMKIKVLSKIARLKCIDPNYCFNDNNFLNYACKINAIEVVESLLQCENIDVNIFTPEKGDTPLITAIQNKNEIIAKLLIEYPQTNINQNNYDEKSAFYFAVVNGQETIVDLLLKSDKFDPKESNINYAFLFSNAEILKLILSYKTFDINYVPLINKENDDIDAKYKYIISKLKRTKKKAIFESRLTKAVKQNEKEIVELIINHPSFDKTKSQYFEAIETSIFENNIELLNQSFKMNINIHPVTDNSNLKIDVFNIDTNENVVSYCITLQSLSQIEIEWNQNGKKYFKVISSNNPLYSNYLNFLLTNGIDINEPLANGQYILEEAIQDNLTDVISSIQLSAIDFNKQISNKNGLSKFTTYLHIAARCGNIGFVQEIIEPINIDINVVNDLGETPLMEAIRFGQLEFVQFLCEIPQLDFRHINNNGEDALQIVKSLNNKNDDLPEYDINTIDRDDYFSLLFNAFDNILNDNN